MWLDPREIGNCDRVVGDGAGVRRGPIDLLAVIDDGPSLDLSLDFLPGLNRVLRRGLWSRDRIDQDPDTDVKKKAVFALSQLPKDEGVPLLIKVARTNPNPEVRKQAMFWLGQSKDARATDFFAEILGKQ